VHIAVHAVRVAVYLGVHVALQIGAAVFPKFRAILECGGCPRQARSASCLPPTVSVRRSTAATRAGRGSPTRAASMQHSLQHPDAGASRQAAACSPARRRAAEAARCSAPACPGSAARGPVPIRVGVEDSCRSQSGPALWPLGLDSSARGFELRALPDKKRLVTLPITLRRGRPNAVPVRRR
jgi:hypothetical protein